MLAAASRHPSADTLGGLAFVLLWSSGYIAAHFALLGMGPFTLAVLRFLGSALLIGAWVLLARVGGAPARLLMHAAISGVLLQAGFFGFMYAGLGTGVPPAVAGLITGLMPLTTALGGALLLSEKLRGSALAGFVLGLAGVLLVIAPDLHGPGSAFGYVCMVLALLSLSVGTLYQKRHVSGLDPRLSLLVQLSAACLVLLPAGLWLEGLRVQAQPQPLLGLLWAILFNSCAGLLLYLALLARGAAGRVASLFYLVPPVTAALAALTLQAHFGAREAAGFALAAAGVWLGQRGSA